jgi:hypothetical protein
MQKFMKIDTELQPATNEIIVIKRRISTFTGSDLEFVLQAQNIQHLCNNTI